MNISEQVEQDFPAVRTFKRVVLIIVGVVALPLLIWNYWRLHIADVKFEPYKAKDVSYKSERIMRGGVYCQNIELDCGFGILANAYSSMVNGKKTMLIDYIAVGDSVVCNTWGTIYVCREGAEPQVFTHDPADYK